MCVLAAMQLQLLRHCFVLPVERKRATSSGERRGEAISRDGDAMPVVLGLLLKRKERENVHLNCFVFRSAYLHEEQRMKMKRKNIFQ